MTADQAGDSKPPRYVGTIGHVSSRKSLMTAAIMKLLAEAGTKQEAQAMAEEQDEKPTAWKSMESAPKDGREILVRRVTEGVTLHDLVNFIDRYGPAWSFVAADGTLWAASQFDAWTDIPS